jgi:sucrose phosphorylase
MNRQLKIINDIHKWLPPEIEAPNEIPKGDMPGDKISIDDTKVKNANVIMPELLCMLREIFENKEKAVVAVHGGSGVGKSEVGSLLAYYLNDLGLGTYILSGDNYPRRIPKINDPERMRVYRECGTKGLVKAGLFSEENNAVLQALQKKEIDSDNTLLADYPWLSVYQETGRSCLKDYLGTPNEIDFDEVSKIIRQFKDGASEIMLKRMGREETELWYDAVDFSEKNILIIEWTHANSDYLEGVDIPILLNSTPEETLAHRKARNRDGGTDSPFVKMVLEIEQEKLVEQSPKAKIIVTKSGELIDYSEYLELMNKMDTRPMLNAYPDSIGGNLSDIADFLAKEEMKDVFKSFYILPSVFNTDLDRGFSVISYDLNERMAKKSDLQKLDKLGIDFKFDFILNHASVLSEQFQDILKNGKASKYKDFFINWNEFWDGYGTMTKEGYIEPNEELIKDMFFRKPGLPILNVRMPDGEEVPYWNTFYQEVNYKKVDYLELMNELGLQYSTAVELACLVNHALDQGVAVRDIEFKDLSSYRDEVLAFISSKRSYLGQMDLNIKSPLVWDFYKDTLKKIASYGANIVRLDAFAYAPKEPGEKNFLNEPGTWDLLEQVADLAAKEQLKILPEIHSKYEEKMHEKIAEKGYMTYDFFLPGLLIDAFLRQTNEALLLWIKDIVEKDIKTVNMLGCHDGIPLLDLKGLLTDKQIQNLIDTVVDRGGYVKDLHGKKNMYYQVNATYYSALGEDDKKLLLARAIQMFMPGKPQIWYLDLFAGKNDHEAVKRAGAGGHKEINRTNLTMNMVEDALQTPIVRKQLELIRFRNTSKAFGFDSTLTIGSTEAHILDLTWKKNGHKARLIANLKDYTYEII